MLHTHFATFQGEVISAFVQRPTIIRVQRQEGILPQPSDLERLYHPSDGCINPIYHCVVGLAIWLVDEVKASELGIGDL